MSPHDLRSNPQDSDGPLPEMQCRMPSQDLAAAAVAVSARREKRLLVLIPGMTTRPNPRHGLTRLTKSASGLAQLEGLAGRSGRIDDVPIDCADILFLLQSGDLGRNVGCITLAPANALLSGRKV